MPILEYGSEIVCHCGHKNYTKIGFSLYQNFYRCNECECLITEGDNPKDRTREKWKKTVRSEEELYKNHK